MPNTGVEGVVLDATGAAIENIGVRVRDTRGAGGSQTLLDSVRWDTTLEPRVAALLGQTRTAANGSFTIHYASLDEPDLEVILTERSGRRLVAKPYSGVIDQTLDTGDWTVPDDARGWVATSGAFAPTDGNEVELLVDNHLAWSRVVDAVDAAAHKINFMLFYLDVGEDYMSFTPDPPQALGAGKTKGRNLEDALAEAGARGVEVRLVVNDLVPVPWPLDTADQIEDHFKNKQGVAVRRFRRFPPVAPVHAKVLVVDDTEAFVIGSPFVQDYYDDVGHSLHDPRRGDKGCEKGIAVPTHDVSACVHGPAVWALNETFRLHWNHVTPVHEQDLPASAVPPEVAGGVTTQLTRSLWGANNFAGLPDGETSILESYLRAIENAETYIYLENQYFTLRELTDALIEVMSLKPQLQLILLTNNKVDIPRYSSWHPQNVTRLFQGLSSVGATPRVGVFTRWSHEEPLVAGGSQRVGRNYVHSKVAVIDDVWATIGSANLDGVSLLSSEHTTRSRIVGKTVRDDAAVRESDVSLVVYDQAAGGNAASVLPATLRKTLWAEHLGYLTAGGVPDPAAAALQAPPLRGWVQLWQDSAEANRLAIRDADTPSGSRILRWPLEDGVTINKVADPARYLSALTIDVEDPDVGPQVAETFDYYSFAKDTWV